MLMDTQKKHFLHRLQGNINLVTKTFFKTFFRNIIHKIGVKICFYYTFR